MGIKIEKQIIALRPHHLLCLPGYKGHNYSVESKNNWDYVSKIIKNNPDMKVIISEGADTLCAKCPCRKQNTNSTCNERNVAFIDKKVKDLLNLKNGITYVYSELNFKLRNLLNEKKHSEICGDCMWRIK